MVESVGGGAGYIPVPTCFSPRSLLFRFFFFLVPSRGLQGVRWQDVGISKVCPEKDGSGRGGIWGQRRAEKGRGRKEGNKGGALAGSASGLAAIVELPEVGKRKAARGSSRVRHAHNLASTVTRPVSVLVPL